VRAKCGDAAGNFFPPFLLEGSPEAGDDCCLVYAGTVKRHIQGQVKLPRLLRQGIIRWTVHQPQDFGIVG